VMFLKRPSLSQHDHARYPGFMESESGLEKSPIGLRTGQHLL
jgi:hypothetical protein